MNPVELRYAVGGMHPTGMGSYAYSSGFAVVVENLAYSKVVGIWGHDAGTGVWGFSPGTHERSVPGNREIWRVTTSSRIDRFAVRYQVAGATFWDNNSGNDYVLDVVAGGGTDGVGTAVIHPNVLHEGSYIDGSGQLVVSAAVKNLAYQKQVGIYYTTNGWLTWFIALGGYQRSYPPGALPGQAQAETWQIRVPVGGGSQADFAVFYTVNGVTYWDNNFGLNYVAS